MQIRMQNISLAGLALMAGWASYALLPAQEPGGADSKSGKVKANVFISQPLNGNVVKGAPYSAEALTETTQTLPDGNRIDQKRSEKLFRDGQGRERREVAEPGSVRISDPVANTSYVLNRQSRTAQKMPDQRMPQSISLSTAAGSLATVAPGTIAAPQIILEGGVGVTGRIILPGAARGGTPVREDLGSRNVEGVVATGTRITTTIPAGEIGNQQPINVIDESWYSSELQMNVMTRHSDPRTGETVYRLTNIFRGEPDPSLFQVPAGYTVNEIGGAGGRGVPGGRSGAKQ